MLDLVSGNGRTGQVCPDGEISMHHTYVGMSTSNSLSDDACSSLNWATKKRRKAADIANVSQGGVDKGMIEFSRQFMGRSLLLIHQMYEAPRNFKNIPVSIPNIVKTKSASKILLSDVVSLQM